MKDKEGRSCKCKWGGHIGKSDYVLWPMQTSICLHCNLRITIKALRWLNLPQKGGDINPIKIRNKYSILSWLYIKQIFVHMGSSFVNTYKYFFFVTHFPEELSAHFFRPHKD